LLGSGKLITTLGVEQVVEPVKRTGLRVVLIFSSSEPNFQQVVEQIGRRASENNDTLEICDTLSLASSDEVHFLNDIRTIPPQVHGQIRSGMGRSEFCENVLRHESLLRVLVSDSFYLRSESCQYPRPNDD
jgi:hypothetical protein